MVTSRSRRLAELEGRLSPTDAVLVWLDDALSFESLPAYARSLVDTSAWDAPVNRIRRRVATNVRLAIKRASPDELTDALREHTDDAVFHYQLVLALNGCVMAFVPPTMEAIVEHILELDDLVEDPFASDRKARRADREADRWFKLYWGGWLERARFLDGSIREEEEAIDALRTRYLAGRDVLFNDARAAWTELRSLSDTLAALALALPTAVGIPERPRFPSEPDADGLRQERVRARIRALADDARLAAFQFLGDGRGAAGILRQRLEPDPQA